MTERALFDDLSPSSLQPKQPLTGESRLLRPNRRQVEWRPVAPESLVGPDHPVRAVAAFVDKLDLAPLRDSVQAKEGRAGRPAYDPGFLFALWIYATTQSESSAREVSRLCSEHDAYRWLCGGLEVSAHTLSDFRSGNRKHFDALLTNVVAVLMQHDLVDLACVAQDGTRVRANAGTSSFRRRKTLEECLREVEKHLVELRALEDDERVSAQRRAARLRGAEDRKARLEEALRQLPAVEAAKAKSRRPGADPEKNPGRISMTDPDARFMKMADGGIRPALNVQFATDTKSQVIVGVAVTNEGTDRAQLEPMLEQLEERHARRPAEHLVDGGFLAKEQIEAARAGHTTVFAPLPKYKNAKRDPHEPRPSDAPAMAELRLRMKTDQAKEKYKLRAATAECVNADARRMGLTQFPSRGLLNALGCALLIAIAHDCMRAIALGVV